MAKATSTQHIVLSVDGSEVSKGALREALKIMNHSTVLHLIQVSSPPGERKRSLFSNEVWSAEMERRYSAHFKAILNDFIQIVKEHKITYKTAELVGDVKSQVCKYCSEINADFLVIGFKTCKPHSQVIKLEKKESNDMPCPILFIGVGNPKYKHIRSRSFSYCLNA